MSGSTGLPQMGQAAGLSISGAVPFLSLTPPLPACQFMRGKTQAVEQGAGLVERQADHGAVGADELDDEAAGDALDGVAAGLAHAIRARRDRPRFPSRDSRLKRSRVSTSRERSRPGGSMTVTAV